MHMKVILMYMYILVYFVILFIYLSILLYYIILYMAAAFENQ